MPRTNKSTYLVLGLLADQPKSGYDIKRDVEQVIGHFWKESFGQIYPVLDRLARQGLIRKNRSSTTGRQRNVFSITPKGQLELDRWLRAAPEPESVRNELLLKVFFGHRLPAAVLIEHVLALRERTEAFERLLAAGASEIASEDLDPRARTMMGLTLRLGVLVAQARLQWAREALDVLEKLS
jgi:PadR family transcriptional regulator, regulatory protein AphA